KFDPRTIDEAVRAADAWLKRQDVDQGLARRILLRLIRLPADKTAFDAVPTVRGALYDLDAAEPVNAVIAGLVAAGVVRVTKAESEELDRVALRSPDLLGNWPTLQGWCEERRLFRSHVGEWESSGRPADALVSLDELDEARQYHDRNKVERDFVNASADRQA